MLLLIPAAPGASAAAPDRADVFGQWTAPFEEGGAGVPRCAPAEDRSGFLVCKPTAQAAALLPDGRVFYYNGLESWENAQHSTFTSAAPSSRDIFGGEINGGLSMQPVQPGHRPSGGEIAAERRNRLQGEISNGQRHTNVGVVPWVRTLWFSLPSTRAAIPRRPCEAMTMRSQPRCFDSSRMAWCG